LQQRTLPYVANKALEKLRDNFTLSSGRRFSPGSISTRSPFCIVVLDVYDGDNQMKEKDDASRIQTWYQCSDASCCSSG